VFFHNGALKTSFHRPKAQGMERWLTVQHAEP